MDAKQIRVHEGGVNPVLPFDILVEILYRLPVKSLIRFRGVSRTWQSLISQPSFVRKHLAHASQPDDLESKKLIIHNSRRAYFDETVNLFCFSVSSVTNGLFKDATGLVCPFEDDNYDIQFLGCCDGMLWVEFKYDFYLWNPAIRKNRKIPSSPGCHSNPMPKTFGFGYDSMNNDYKLLILCDNYSTGGIETRLYSLNNNSWRIIGEPLRHLVFCSYTYRSAFVNGAIHWLLRQWDSAYVILSYDLSDDKYKELPLPEGTPLSLSLVLGLTVSRDMLCLLTGHINSQSIVFWMMKDYGIKESWTKSFTMSCHFRDIKPLYWSDGVAMMMPDDDVLVMRKKDGSILRKEFVVRLYGRLRQEVVCVESLISPWVA